MLKLVILANWKCFSIKAFVVGTMSHCQHATIHRFHFAIGTFANIASGFVAETTHPSTTRSNVTNGVTWKVIWNFLLLFTIFVETMFKI